MELGIKGKRAVVTGAGQGIGRETALVLAQEGAVVCVSDINDSRGKETVEEICERGGTGIYIHADVGVPEEIKHLFRTAAERLGSVDILINNAAKQTQNAFFDMKVEEFKDVINVNLNGTFICSNIIGKTMGKGGKIINMLSVHYNLPRKNKYHYDASKAGVAMLTKEMALDLVERGITVNAISYGACNTPMNSDWINDKEKVKETKDKIPMKWIAEPEEIANFVKIIL